MNGTCICLTCQVNRILTTEVERRGSRLDATEIISLGTDLLASALHGMSPEQRAFASLEAGMAVSIKLRMMDAAEAGIPIPTHETEARIQ